MDEIGEPERIPDKKDRSVVPCRIEWVVPCRIEWKEIVKAETLSLSNIWMNRGISLQD